LYAAYAAGYFPSEMDSEKRVEEKKSAQRMRAGLSADASGA
jgi:hypothetical protein